MDFQAPRGMRDFYPDDMAFRNHLFGTFRDTARSHGFDEYDAPVVETLELLVRKAGEEIVDQIYAFEDKSGRKLALRPEVTPSLVRLVASRRGEMSMPVKWFTVAQCFRYERMSKGRKREHFQWNADIIGSESVTAEVEVLSTAVDALRNLGLNHEDVNIFIGSRKLVAELLTTTGVPEDKQMAVFMVLDKRGKVSDQVLLEMLGEAGIESELANNIMGIFDISGLDDAASKVSDDSPAVAELRNLFAISEKAGIADFLKFDIGIVRGLAYYTGIVFEAFDTKREFRAIFGGGRYDKLFESLGEPPLPAVGFGFGDVVIHEVMKSKQCSTGGGKQVDVCVGVFDASLWPDAMRIASAIRATGKSVDLAMSAVGPKKLFKYANAINAGYTAFLAPEEFEAGQVVVRNMESRDQNAVAMDKVTEEIR